MLRTGDHKNKVKDEHEQEFDVEMILMHDQYDCKLSLSTQIL